MVAGLPSQVQRVSLASKAKLIASSSLISASIKQILKKLVEMRLTRLSKVSMIGLALSLYAIYVEMKKNENSDFNALCDISETMSCSKVF